MLVTGAGAGAGAGAGERTRFRGEQVKKFKGAKLKESKSP